MEDKDIEQMLKDSADKIKMKDFSERWEAISDRIQAGQSCECKETVQSAVLVAPNSKTVTEDTFKKKIIISICSLFAAVLICLAILLPVVLNKKKEPTRYLFNSLLNSQVTGSEFFDAVDNSDLVLIGLSGYELNAYTLYHTPDNNLVGGKIELNEEEFGALVELAFYKYNVTSKFEVGTEYEEYTVNGYKIIYNTENSEDFYTTKAKATKGNMVYDLNVTSLDDNLTSLFDKLFG